MRNIIAFLFLIFLLSGCKIGHRSTFEPGAAAPPFKLVDLTSDKEIALENFKGRVVLLTFMASWCGNCLEEVPALEGLHREFEGRGLSVIAVGIKDSRENLKSLLASSQITFPVLYDEKDEISSLYKTTGVPESFVIDRDGNFVLFLDPDTNDGVVRILGPRSWESDTARRRISAVLR